MIAISLLKKSDKIVLRDINVLLRELSGDDVRLLTLAELKKIIADANVFLYGARDGKKIIGMATLVLVRVPRGFHATIESVVVSAAYRGHGIGKLLTARLIKEAKKKRVLWIDLNSKPHRVAANGLYQKLGFQKRETNAYRLSL